jgi:hypothetical protein
MSARRPDPATDDRTADHQRRPAAGTKREVGRLVLAPKKKGGVAGRRVAGGAMCVAVSNRNSSLAVITQGRHY